VFVVDMVGDLCVYCAL